MLGPRARGYTRSGRSRLVPVVLGCVLPLALPIFSSGAEPPAEQESSPERVWSTSTEVGYALTQGNSETETLTVKGRLLGKWKKQRFRLQLDMLKTDSADDNVAVTDCQGQDLETCFDNLPSDPSQISFRVEKQEKEPDLGRYFLEGSYERDFGKRRFWNIGINWLRDVDTGIDNQYAVFGGVGHTWWDREDLKFTTSYGLSYTTRLEETPDPQKDERFAGTRLEWRYLQRWGKLTTYTNDLSFTMSIKDTSDYGGTWTHGLAVEMNTVLALKVTLGWKYASEPALDDIDLFLDPNQRIKIGSVDARKEKLDTTLSTTLVIKL